ncbi:MAG: hypothetical protein AVDCRST_MAG17-751, partial [uncultured Solirubrobacterales bacterium]
EDRADRPGGRPRHRRTGRKREDANDRGVRRGPAGLRHAERLRRRLRAGLPRRSATAGYDDL